MRWWWLRYYSHSGVPNGGPALTGPSDGRRHSAQLQLVEHLFSAVQAQSAPHLQPSPQLQAFVLFAPDGAQLQAILFSSVFIGTSLVCGLDEPYITKGSPSHLHERAKLFAVPLRKSRTCAGTCG